MGNTLCPSLPPTPRRPPPRSPRAALCRGRRRCTPDPRPRCAATAWWWSCGSWSSRGRLGGTRTVVGRPGEQEAGLTCGRAGATCGGPEGARARRLRGLRPTGTARLPSPGAGHFTSLGLSFPPSKERVRTDPPVVGSGPHEEPNTERQLLFWCSLSLSRPAPAVAPRPQRLPLALRPQAKHAGHPPSKTGSRARAQLNLSDGRWPEGTRLACPHLPRAACCVARQSKTGNIRNLPEALTFQRPTSFPCVPAGLTPSSAGLI